jgi:hypothetical protein
LGVYVSLDDGDHWQPLQFNLPVSPVHDLVVKNNDVVIATHGRSFWILDDITPLRQVGPEVANSAVHLFKPATAMRIRPNINPDTPLPPEEPAGENPPPGAVLYYHLKSPSQGGVTLEILDAGGKVIRRYSSNDRAAAPATPPAIPSSWIRPAAPISAEAGTHRFLWDLRQAPLPVESPEYPMSTAFNQPAPPGPLGPHVLPGSYQVRLTAEGQTLTQPLEVTMDPRVQVSREELEKQFALEMKIADGLARDEKVIQEIRAWKTRAGSDLAKKATELLGQPEEEGRRPSRNKTSLLQLNAVLAHLADVVDSADAAPTAQATAAVDEALGQLRELVEQWGKLSRARN